MTVGTFIRQCFFVPEPGKGRVGISPLEGRPRYRQVSSGNRRRPPSRGMKTRLSQGSARGSTVRSVLRTEGGSRSEAHRRRPPSPSADSEGCQTRGPTVHMDTGHLCITSSSVYGLIRISHLSGNDYLLRIKG